MPKTIPTFDMPDYTAEVDGVGTCRLLEAIRSAGLETKTNYVPSPMNCVTMGRVFG